MSNFVLTLELKTEKWQEDVLDKRFNIGRHQYNHVKDEYIKKDLSERWNNLGCYKIQRDLYSAFLIMNINDNLKEINRDLCIETFDIFKELHNKEVERIRNSNNKLISSMGI